MQKQALRDGHLPCTEINTGEGEKAVCVTLCGKANAGGGKGGWQQYKQAERVQLGVLRGSAGKMHMDRSRGSINSGKGVLRTSSRSESR